MNIVHASLDSGSHTKVHRRMEDLVHAPMRLENANYGKILKTFYVAKCHASSVYGTYKGWPIKVQLFFGLKPTCLCFSFAHM